MALNLAVKATLILSTSMTTEILPEPPFIPCAFHTFGETGGVYGVNVNFNTQILNLRESDGRLNLQLERFTSSAQSYRAGQYSRRGSSDYNGARVVSSQFTASVTDDLATPRRADTINECVPAGVCYRRWRSRPECVSVRQMWTSAQANFGYQSLSNCRSRSDPVHPAQRVSSEHRGRMTRDQGPVSLQLTRRRLGAGSEGIAECRSIRNPAASAIGQRGFRFASKFPTAAVDF